MEIIIGYFLGAFVLVLLFISLFKMASNRMTNSKRELNERIDNLERRIKDLDNK
ncbi:hypothetical protein [Aquibacillus salsiterrae]|uniref:DUF4083 domain-containing protein n=1 Tax=Aquibacillus salsiterrae TaxID=2950439 RepID=A0A9X3WGW2_9BACI|nr:hypothetical protein [Aquibacillus salsiterrae]MDC3418398.1 hypothetical protein [Aquibacillus salsiterrae]